MLLSYALNPTHSTQSLADVAARHGQRRAVHSGRWRRGDSGAGSGAEGGSRKGRRERVYTEIDLAACAGPLSHGAGRRAHRSRPCSTAFRSASRIEIGARGRAHLRACRPALQHQLAQAAWRSAVHASWVCPRPPAAAKAKPSPPRRMCWSTWRRSTTFRAWCSSSGICPN